MLIVVYSLTGIHDVIAGGIIAAITIAYLKSRAKEVQPQLGLVVLAIIVLSFLLSPLHGKGISGILILTATYVYLYKTWDEFQTTNWEIPALILVVFILMVINIVIGLRLTGAI